MKQLQRSLGFFSLFFALASVSLGQVTLYSESFETDGEGSRYTSNTFNNAALSDVWERTNQNPHPYHSTGIASGTEDGTFYWAGEDIQSTLGTATDAFVELDPVSVSGFSSLDVQIALGISRFGQNRWENDDYIIVEYNMDNTGWNIIGLFMGNNAATAVGGQLRQDTDNNIATFGPFGTEVTGTFADFTFPVGVTGNNIEVRVRTNCDGSEEPGFDFIRIRGIASSNNAPVLANIEGSTITFNEGGSAVQVTNTITVTDNDDVNIEGATVTFCNGYVSGEDFFSHGGAPGVSGSFLPSSGVLTFSGTASKATYETLLKSVLYGNNDPADATAGTRQICFQVNDGTDNSNIVTRDVNVVTSINTTPVALPFCESFETNGEGVRYESDNFTSGCTFAERGPAGTNVGGCFAEIITGADGSFVFNTEATDANGGFTMTSQPFAIGIAGLADITFEILLGVSRDDEARWENDDQVRIEYSIDNGPFQIAGLFTGNNPASGLGGELREDLDQNPGTFGPFGASAVPDVFTNYSWTVQETGTNVEFRVVVNTNGSEELAFDNICISSSLACSNDTTNIAAVTCDPSQVGVTQQTLTNFCGADSILITTTTLLPSDTTNVAAATCDPGQVGVTVQVFTNQFGCDSTVITTTTLLPSDTTNVAAATCDPGQVGVTVQVFTNQFGCDSTVITTTTLLPSDTTNVAAATCDPGQVGVTVQVFTNQFGCDSTVITTTTLLPSDTTNVAAATCDPGQVGVTVQVFTNQFGCDSTVITNTTLLPSDTTNVAASTCDPGQVGVTVQVFTNQFGCDSTVITNTTLLPSDTTNVAAATCDPGQVGVTVQVFTNQFGCDSTVITNTTLLPSDTTVVAAGSCDPGQVGVTQELLTNQFGCDSLVITVTTLLPSDTTVVPATTCDPAQVGVTQELLTNQFGCDSLVITVTTLLPLPDAGSNAVDTVCETTIVDLLALISAPGGSFEDPGATGGLSGSDFNTTGLPPGDYPILYIVPSGNICPNDTAVITITVEENVEEICVINTYDTSNPDDHVFVFFDFPKASGGLYQAARFVWDGAPGQLTVNADGTATIAGKVKLKQDANVKFDVFFLLENKMDWTTWSGLGRTYAYKPATQAVAAFEHVNWDYYEMSNTSNLTGCPGSTYDGDVINLTHRPVDLSKGFQVGFAANEKDNDKGIAGWFNYSATLGGVTYSDWGDMNADLDCSFSDCVDCTVDFTTNASPEVCSGAGGGSITVNATGGSGVYDFSDDGGASWITGTGLSSLTFVNLTGMVQLRVRDANDINCRSDIRYVDLTGPSPDFTTSTVDATCADREDGSIDINVTAGNGPFMFSLDGGAFEGSGSTYTFSNLAPGDHTIQVKDFNGCLSDVRTVTTGANNPPSFDINVTHESSPGANDGAITVVVTSGVPPFLFSNDNGATFVPGVGNTHIFTGLTVGIYDILVQDGNGCVSSRLPAFVSGAGFCPPSSIIDQVFESHPGDDGKNARFMCEDQSPALLYKVQNLSGLQAFYFDWEVSGIQGKKVGDRPTVDGVVPATDGSVGGATNPVNTNTTYIFDANGKIFGLESNVNSERRISLAIQPYMINDDGTTCPANADTWKVYIYPRGEAELDNAVVPGTAIVINSGDDPTGAISIDNTTKIHEKKGILLYDVHIDPNPDITELAAGLDLTDVGASTNNTSDKDYDSPIDLGLSSLTNTSGGAVTVTVEVTPKYDPDHARAADKDAVTNPNGYCPGATQTIDIIVNSSGPRSGRNGFEVNGKGISFNLYPNPAQEQFFLQASAVLEEATSFEISNMLGQQIMAGQIDAGNAREKVNINHLAAGVYMVRVLNPGGKDAILRFEKTN